MPSNSLDLLVFTRAKDVPSDAIQTMQEHAREANVVLPLLLKVIKKEERGEACFVVVILFYREKVLEYILSIADGPMGAYPVMIMTTIPLENRTKEVLKVLEADMGMLAKELDTVQFAGISIRERVYSVFGPDLIARSFAKQWSLVTQIVHYQVPYYAAKITYCTTATLNPDISLKEGYTIQLAESSHIEGIAELCYRFAEGSTPFTLSEGRARQEAEILVQDKQVWVLLAGQQKDVACIVAYTRNSDTVGAITKVYTNPKWRGHGLAKCLVHQVCKELLQTKQSIVLYVALDNEPANAVYNRVGFAGLADVKPVKGVEEWTEIGFDRDQVTLGHW